MVACPSRQAAWKLAADFQAGAASLELIVYDGLAVGDTLELAPGTTHAEILTISGFGSLALLALGGLSKAQADHILSPPSQQKQQGGAKCQQQLKMTQTKTIGNRTPLGARVSENIREIATDG